MRARIRAVGRCGRDQLEAAERVSDGGQNKSGSESEVDEAESGLRGGAENGGR